jgi:hypothetical protein
MVTTTAGAFTRFLWPAGSVAALWIGACGQPRLRIGRLMVWGSRLLGAQAADLDERSAAAADDRARVRRMTHLGQSNSSAGQQLSRWADGSRNGDSLSPMPTPVEAPIQRLIRSIAR